MFVSLLYDHLCLSVYVLKLWMSYESITSLKWKMLLITKEQEVHDFEFILETSLIILMWWQYFLFSEWMLEQCICLLNLLFMNVKIVGSWKNDEKGEMLLIIWKIIKLILEARKSSKEQSLQKKKRKKIKNRRKKIERKRKSKQKKPKLLKPRGKSKKPITLKTKRQG